ncbi:hypothetical protein BJ996_000031 [Streptomyces phaeogriseichromatogenes]|nr:Tn3 family transposase [Streptomyces murinus]MBA9043300.1 hypothetical protein [Streptomyces murinus]
MRGANVRGLAAATPYDVIRMLSGDERPTPFGDAIAHYGRIARTLHILRLADEPGYRRQIKSQANLQGAATPSPGRCSMAGPASSTGATRTAWKTRTDARTPPGAAARALRVP